MNVAIREPRSKIAPVNGLSIVRLIRFSLPLFLFLLATSFEIGEHLMSGEGWTIGPTGRAEVLIFGILGPSAVFLALTYVLHLLTELESARSQTVALNQNLERLVAARTAALQASNNALEQANARLLELDRMKSDFVSLVSHELRAPLATLNGGLEVATRDMEILNPRTQRVLRLLVDETQRLTQFVQTLLDVAQLQAGKLQFTCGPVSVRPMLTRAVEVVLGPEQNRVVWRLPNDLPPLLADEVYTEQVLRNLLSNALKYTPSDSPIELSVTVGAQTMRICVTDYGPGIPAAEQMRIFDRFHRLHSNDERTARGWGLGLHFAQALVQAQGGTLTVQSPVHDPPQLPGARFIVTLPIAGEEADHAEVAADR